MTKHFRTTQTDLMKLNGSIIMESHEVDKKEYDYEDLGYKMFRIKLEKGEELIAYEDEIVVK